MITLFQCMANSLAAWSNTQEIKLITCKPKYALFHGDFKGYSLSELLTGLEPPFHFPHNSLSLSEAKLKREMKLYTLIQFRGPASNKINH